MTRGSGQPFQFKMMVNRRHAENTPAGQLKGRHLQNDRHSLQHKNAAHNEKYDFVTCNHRHRAQGRASGQCPHITHEYLGRVGVEPQEAESGAGDGATKNSQLTTAGDIGNMQVVGKVSRGRSGTQ